MRTVLHSIKEISSYSYVLALSIVSLVLGSIFYFSGNREYITELFKYTLIIGSIPVWYRLLRDLSSGFFGVDIIAGVALIGTFIINQYLAGVVVLLMLAGGQFFERYAMRRARKELSSLLSRTPTFVHQKIRTTLKDVNVADVTIGMEVLIKTGEVIAVDGIIVEGDTVIDESSLTGESIPVTKHKGSNVYAGTENNGGIIVVKVITLPKDTKYQSIISLVKHAEDSMARTFAPFRSWLNTSWHKYPRFAASRPQRSTVQGHCPNWISLWIARVQPVMA